MRYIYSIVKADYLQRTRSYAFLITLAITVYAAYSFVPPPTASYTTLNIVGYKGVYNSAWVGHVSAMMTTIMLSLYGFFLINGGIKKDIDTEVGLIVATTQISNFGYLLNKFFSNFLVLLTIMGCTFAVSIVMFFVRTTGYPFIISDFVVPYLLFAIPALLVVSSLSVVAEVFLGKRSILQYIVFFMFFGAMLANVTNLKNDNTAIIADAFGVRTMTSSIRNKVNTQYHENVAAINLGFTFNSHKKAFRTFVWNGVNWTGFFLFSRFLWICIAFALVYFSSFFFHRFDVKQRFGKKKKALIKDHMQDVKITAPVGVSMAALPPVVADYGIYPFIKTELLLLIRQGSKWFWLITAGVWVAMLFAPFNISYGYLLPVIWFLQVTRWSELVTKEKFNRLHYFTYSSYKPLQRMLPAQMFAGVLLALALALPIIVRSIATLQFYSIINIINGAIFVIALAACIGIVSGGKKLFEIIYFLLSYCVVEALPPADYLGAMPKENPLVYVFTMLLLNTFLILTSFTVRSYQARHL